MTAREAYEKLCDHVGEKVKVVIGREYPNFFGFFFVNKGSFGKLYVGGSMTLVSKKSGKVISEDDLRIPIKGRFRFIRLGELKSMG